MDKQNPMEDEKNIRQSSMPAQIDLFDLFKHILKFWPLLILGMLLGALLLGGLRYRKKYTYTSSSMLYVLASNNTVTNVSDLQLSTQLSTDFVSMVKSKPVLDSAVKAAKKELGVTLTRDDVSDALSVSHADETRILTIICTTEDAELSKVLCDAVTETTSTRMSEITQTDPPTLVESAEVATKHDPRGVLSQAEKGAVAGLGFVIVLLVAAYLLNDKVSKSTDVERYLGEVVIGVVPFEKSLVYRGKKGRRKKK